MKLRSVGGLVEFVAPHVAACTENALRFHRQLYGYDSREPVAILLEDFSDFGHGGANTVPTNFVDLGIAPFSYVYDTVPAVDRMFWMANHEMAHVVTMDQATGRDLRFRGLFRGKVQPVAAHPESIFYNYLTNPRWNAPRWYHEGIAVFLETWMAGGLGRALGAYDEMTFRSMVLDEAPFWDVVGLESEGTASDFQVGVNAYLYGTRFMTYLAHQYGPQKLIEWTGRRPGSEAYFSRQFRHVYGVSLDTEWRRWIAFERDWQRRNLESVRRQPITPFRPLSAVPLGSVSRAFLDPARNKIYVAVRSLGKMAPVIAIDRATGKSEEIAEVRGPALFYVTSLAYDQAGGKLFFTADNYGWRDLYAVDLRTRKTERLMRDGRIGDLAFAAADRALWGIRHFNGISTLVRLKPPYATWEQMHSFPYGDDLYDIDVSPDGRLLTGSLARVDGSQLLVAIPLAELAAGEVSLATLYDFEVSAPENFVFSPDGRYLYGSSAYSGVSNVYRYDLEHKDIDILTNAETGFFRPVPLGGDELLVFRYSGEGLQPGVVPERRLEHVGAIRFLGQSLVERSPELKQWKVPSPATTDAASLQVARGPYDSLRHLSLDSIYPIVAQYKDSPAAGLAATISDSLNLSRIDLAVSYSPDTQQPTDERLHAEVSLRHWGWGLEATYNRADFYDLFGPTKTSRRGYSLGTSWSKVLRYDEPRRWTLDVGLVGWGNLETLPEAQNIAAGTDRLLDGRVTVGYEFVEKSLGASEPEEQGLRWRLHLGGRHAAGDTFSRLSGDLDVGWLLPIPHSSLWLRSSAGIADGRAGDPAASFYFGAFGNNYVDHQAARRYRQPESFPGLEINEVGGRDYGKVMVEWMLPPLRFRHAGTPGFYLTWAEVGLFSSLLRTEFDDRALERTVYDLGAQVDLKMVIFSNLSTTLSLGYARARQESGPSSDEFMASLKIL
ncbi:MAG TPA: hypothetical protein VGD06_07835 [Acidobacteriota bacterium]